MGLHRRVSHGRAQSQSLALGTTRDHVTRTGSHIRLGPLDRVARGLTCGLTSWRASLMRGWLETLVQFKL